MSSLPAKSLTVTAPGIALQGTSIYVKVGGLKWREPFTITIDGVTLAESSAPLLRSATVLVPLGETTTGNKAIVATGASPERTGTRKVTVGDNLGPRE